MHAVREAVFALGRLLRIISRGIGEFSRRWDERVLGGISLRIADHPPIAVAPHEMEWRPWEGSFVWCYRLSRAEVVSDFQVHRGDQCLVRVRPQVPLYLLPDDELTLRVPGVIHPFGSFNAFPDRCELELPNRPADTVRVPCLGCGREFPAIEMWMSKRFEGKAYCDACYYARFRPRRRDSPRNGGSD